MMEKESVFSREAIIEHFQGPPSLPRVLASLSELGEDSTETTTTLRELVCLDAGLACRILVLANSLEYAGAFPTTSIRGALTRIGAHVALETLGEKALIQTVLPRRREVRELWQHSILMAVACREIARHGRHQLDEEEAAAMGLIHDLGRFAVLAFSPERHMAVEERGWATPRHILALERSLHGFDHAELGAELAVHIGLPQRCADLIRWHHHYESLPDDLDGAEELAPMIRVMQQADFLTTLLLRVPGELIAPPRAQEKVLESRCCGHEDDPPLGGRELVQILARVETRARELADLLGVAGF